MLTSVNTSSVSSALFCELVLVDTPELNSDDVVSEQTLIVSTSLLKIYISNVIRSLSPPLFLFFSLDRDSHGVEDIILNTDIWWRESHCVV
mmetsp:Transcript_9810/g.20352  ORF Transcript_9810/g.20352 Transcript_9810/m.20352 type:complete len:91 (-) Transcript_9810:26-298(-)